MPRSISVILCAEWPRPPQWSQPKRPLLDRNPRPYVALLSKPAADQVVRKSQQPRQRVRDHR